MPFGVLPPAFGAGLHLRAPRCGRSALAEVPHRGEAGLEPHPDALAGARGVRADRRGLEGDAPGQAAPLAGEPGQVLHGRGESRRDRAHHAPQPHAISILLEAGESIRHFRWQYSV